MLSAVQHVSFLLNRFLVKCRFPFPFLKSPSVTQMSVSQENAWKKQKAAGFLRKTIGSNNSFTLIANDFRFQIAKIEFRVSLHYCLWAKSVLERVRTRTRTQWVSPSPSPDSDSTLVDSDSDSDSTSVDSDSSAADSDSGLMDSDSDSDSTQLDSDSQWVQVSPVRKVQGKFKLSCAVMDEIRGRN